jgi:hypothetical protein
LTAWLRGLDVDQLTKVLAARPEIAHQPEPRDLSELAQRLQHPASVQAALLRTPLAGLQLAEALVALGSPATRAQLARLLGDDGLDDALRTLTDLVLVWPDQAGAFQAADALDGAWETPLGVNPSITDAISASSSDVLGRLLGVLRLPKGRSKAERVAALLAHHRDPDTVRALVATAPAATRELLDEHAAGTTVPRMDFFGSRTGRIDQATQWAIDRGLLIGDPYGFGTHAMPAEVAIALRGPEWWAPFTPVPPALTLFEVPPAEIDRAAAAAASGFVVTAAALLAEAARQPISMLGSGGVGVRELARLGKAVQADGRSVRLALETADAAGLLAAGSGLLKVTTAYGVWARQEPADRLTALQLAWWQLGWTPTQSRGDDGKTLPALANVWACEGCLISRHGLVERFAAFPAGHGARSTAELGAVLHWYRPLAHVLEEDKTPYATAIAEAELLGVLALGACSSLGVALREGDNAALSDHANRLLPAATNTVRLGTDLTAIVAGSPGTALAALLDAVADRESRSTASVWRFSNASVRRALDSGYKAEEIEAKLAKVASGPFPQPLSYLIKDVARTHGNLRVAAATCVIHSSDVALIAEVTANRKLAKFGLRQLAPTVAVGTKSVTETLTALRIAGYAPLAEEADGTVRLERPKQVVARDRKPARLPSAEKPVVDLVALAKRLHG